MAAAVLQGVPVVTSDIDFWIGLPEREHDRVLRICHQLGAKIVTDHIVELADGLELNFTYRVDGLSGFKTEFERAKRLLWLNRRVAVLPLERLIKSKEAVGRAKDRVHLVYLRQALKLKR